MLNVLILGAGGQIASMATDLFLQRTDVHITLFLRHAKAIKHLANERVTLIEGDVLDYAALQAAMLGQDVVYANLSGELVPMAQNIVQTMSAAGVKRLIFISSMGIYDEVVGEKYGSVLAPYRQSAALIEASNLDYTIIRPAWLDNSREVAYATTQKGEPFKNAAATVSRKSVADLVVQLSTTPDFAIKCSLGVHHA